MTADPNVDLKADRLFFLGTGLIYKTVCAPKSWTGEQVSDEATKADPPGTSNNRWVVTDPESSLVSDDENNPFRHGNPQPCADDPDRQHWLLNC